MADPQEVTSRLQRQLPGISVLLGVVAFLILVVGGATLASIAFDGIEEGRPLILEAVRVVYSAAVVAALAYVCVALNDVRSNTSNQR